jgi:DMSO/TMAO reductase YedYZ molybdopterin-dependent catalytic subunit
MYCSNTPFVYNSDMDKKFTMPPGQRITSRWYAISSLGKPKSIDIDKYFVKIYGLVEEEKIVSFKKILTLPTIKKDFDIHCVDGWSYLGTVFEGIYPRELFKGVKIKDNGKFVIVHTVEGYSTDLPLDFLLSNNVILAYKVNGENLSFEHGYPLRLVVNGKYAYKDAKWVNSFEIVEKDIPGYWEERGYSRSADIYKEERFESR